MSRKIVAFVDHEIGHRLLSKMIDQQATLDLELIAVVTTIDNGKFWWPGVEALCQSKGIDLHRYREDYTDFANYPDADVYLLLSWKHIIPLSLVERPRLGAINLHYSLIPEYRGVYPVNWALIDGNDSTGVTYHFIGSGIDDGQIICQKKLNILPSDTARTLQLRLDDLAFDLFDEVIELIVRGGSFKSISERPRPGAGSYKSRADFVSSNELDLNRFYKARDFINLLRGKTFLPESKNLYFLDPKTGHKIYISITLTTDNEKS